MWQIHITRTARTGPGPSQYLETEAVDVTIGTAGGPAPAPISVEPGASLALGAETAVPLASVPAAPGDVVPLQVSTPGTGQNVVTVPVLPALGYYEGSKPSVSPSARSQPRAKRASARVPRTW